jgi:lipid-binding SYLF domain-containing protein
VIFAIIFSQGGKNTQKTRENTRFLVQKNFKNFQEWGVPSSIAKEIGVPTSTLASACKRGFVTTDRLGDGTIVVHRLSAKNWEKSKDPKVRRKRN